MIALLGNLARDVFPGGDVCPGGAPYHAARALARLDVPAELYARCARADRDLLVGAVEQYVRTVRYVPGEATASFAIAERGELREMEVLVVGDSWRPSDLPALAPSVGWAHVGPLLRSDFPPETLAQLARGRRLSLDGQALVRAPRLGPLRLDADYDPRLLAHVWVLKLSDEEAAVLGDLGALGVPELLVTHGAAGATLYLEGQREEIRANPVGGNHTGTGDAFAVSYLSARDAGLAPGPAARRAAALVETMLADA